MKRLVTGKISLQLRYLARTDTGGQLRKRLTDEESVVISDRLEKPAKIGSWVVKIWKETNVITITVE